MRLRTQLFQFGVGTIVPPLALAVVLGVLLVKYEQDAFRRGALDRNRAFMTAVDAEIRGHIAALSVLGASKSLEQSDATSFREEARWALRLQRDWHQIEVLQPTGAVLMSSEAAGEWSPIAVADEASVARVVRTAQPVVGNISFRHSPARPYVPVAVPIVFNGTVAYVLVAGVDLAPFARLIEAQRLPVPWITGLVDESGHFVARVPARSPSDTASADYLAAIQRSPEGWYRGKTVEGRDTFTAFRTSELTHWTVGFAIPADEVNAAGIRAAWLVGLGALLSIALALSFAYWMGRRISTPISALAAAARTLGSDAAPPGTLADTEIREVNEVAHALVEASAAIRERERLNEREQTILRAADRAKDEFLAMLGHELRNPLSAVSNAAALLARADLSASNRAAAQAIIARQTEQLTRLVNDLLDVGRVVAGKIHLERVPVDLADIAGATVAAIGALGQSASHRITVNATERVFVEGDPTRLEQVVSNMLSNAIAYTPPNGVIDVSVAKDAGWAVLRVADTGAGIKDDDRAAIFDLFYQADKGLHRKGGLGIGLTLVKRLVEMHGGSVSVFSGGLAKGSTFTVRLPLLERVPKSGQETPVAERVSGLHILVVDDSDDARVSMRMLLESDGHVVHLAEDGPTGVAAALAVKPHFALIDIGMPGMDGYEVARQIRRHLHGDVTLIATTGYGQPDDVKRAIDAGFDAHLVKPVSLMSLHVLFAKFGRRPDAAAVATGEHKAKS